MAGDLSISERVFLQPLGLDEAAFRAVAPGVSVLHEYGERVRIAADDVDGSRALAAAFAEDEIAVDTAPELDPDGRLGLDAFVLRISKEFREAAESHPLNGRQWDYEGPMSAPDPPLEGAMEDEAPPILNAPAAARPLAGRIAVGTVIVEGPAAALEFTAGEQTGLAAQIQNGLTFLAGQTPGSVTWVHETTVVAINEPVLGPGGTYQSYEAAFRDPALAHLGFPPGADGVATAVVDLCARKACASGMLAFFTKYPTGHFAYAWPNDAFLVMNHANDGWGPDRIDRVFAHETCHLFGCPDEYAASGCRCDGSWGSSGGPNGNCENCDGETTADCIMRKNEWAMCSFTRGHLGI